MLLFSVDNDYENDNVMNMKLWEKSKMLCNRLADICVILRYNYYK